jgi:hypothetical protein
MVMKIKSIRREPGRWDIIRPRFAVILITFCLLLSFIACTTKNRSSSTDDPLSTIQFIINSTRPALQNTPSFHFQSMSESQLATNYAPVELRTAKCKDGYTLIAPEELEWRSTDKWTIYSCTQKLAGPYDSNIRTPDVIYRKNYTQIQSIDLSKVWSVEHQDFEWSNRANSRLISYRWTADGNYVVLRPYWNVGVVDGFPKSVYFRNDNALYRLDLRNGEMQVILPYKGSYAFLLSNDDQKLAYTEPDRQNIINILDIPSGLVQSRNIGSSYILSGRYAWNPNDSKVVFAAALPGWEAGKAGISVFVLDIDTLVLTNLLDNDLRLIIPFIWAYDTSPIWISDYLVEVEFLNYEYDPIYRDNYLDIRSGKIIPALSLTPTY